MTNVTLSNKFYKKISDKLILKTLLIQENKLFLQKLKNKIHEAQSLKIKKIDTPNFTFFNTNDLNIFYTITVSFLKANTTIQISSSCGKSICFFSSGDVGLLGKQKKNRKTALIKLISLLTKEGSRIVKKKPVSVHFINVKFYKKVILKKLKHSFFITLIKSFNNKPFNGCRKRKVSRKKHIKSFK